MTEYKIIQAEHNKIGEMVYAAARDGWKPTQLTTAVLPVPPPQGAKIWVTVILEHTPTRP